MKEKTFMEYASITGIVLILVIAIAGAMGSGKRSVSKGVEVRHAKNVVSVAKRGGEVVLLTAKQEKERRILRELFVERPTILHEVVLKKEHWLTKTQQRQAYNDLFR